MEIVLVVAFVVSVLAWSAVLNFCIRYSKVLRWLIGYVAPPGLTKHELSTYTAALAPWSYLKAIDFQMGLPVVILVLGTLIKWYLGVLGLVASVAVCSVLAVFVSGTIEKYVYQIVLGLQRKVADYKRVGDADRAEAAEELLEPLKIIYEQVRGKNYRVPPSGNISVEVEVPYVSPLWRS